MKAYRLLLTKDKRADDVVHYKEFQGRKLFLTKPKTDLAYIGTFNLFDLTTKRMRKQKVFYRVVSVGKHNISVEVI